MNLKKEQELENLKSESDALWKKVDRKRQQLKEATLDKACQDFKKYFREQEFKLEEGEVRDPYHRPNYEKQIVATYGKIRVALSLPNYQSVFMGAEAYLLLDIMGNSVGQCTLEINTLGVKGGLKATIIDVPQTAEGRLDKEIKDTEEGIEKFKQELENFDKKKLGFSVFGVGKVDRFSTAAEFPSKNLQFESLREFLEAVFESE